MNMLTLTTILNLGTPYDRIKKNTKLFLVF